MSPNSPSASWLGPAVKYRAPGVTLSEPAGNRSPHSPEMVIGPRWVRSWPRNWPEGGVQVQQGAVRPEDVDEAVARPGVVVLLGRVLLGEGDVQVAADVVDAERGEAGRDGGGGGAGGPAEAAIEDLDGAEPEVGGVQELAGRGADQGESLVFRAVVAGPVGDGGPVHGDDRAGGIDGGVPAGDRAVLGGEQEPGGGGDAVPGYQETIW